MVRDEPQCPGPNREGGPCGARVQPGREWCQWHDPARAAERAEWRRKGGKARSSAARARREIELADAGIPALPGILFGALRKVERGALDPPVASAMATLSRALIAAQQAHELEERLAALEARAGIGRTA